MKVLRMGWGLLMSLSAASAAFRFKHDVDAEFVKAFKQLNSLEQKAKDIETGRLGLASTTRTSLAKLKSIEQADHAAMLETVDKGEKSLDLLNSRLMRRLSTKMNA